MVVLQDQLVLAEQEEREVLIQEIQEDLEVVEVVVEEDGDLEKDQVLVLQVEMGEMLL